MVYTKADKEGLTPLYKKNYVSKNPFADNVFETEKAIDPEEMKKAEEMMTPEYEKLSQERAETIKVGETIAEDAEMQRNILKNKEEIIRVAEEYIRNQENKLQNRASKFATIGAGVVAILESAAVTYIISRHGIDGTSIPNMEWAFIGAVAATGLAAGAATGGLTGKFTDYLERRKFNKQKEEIQNNIGKKPATFEDIRRSTAELKN